MNGYGVPITGRIAVRDHIIDVDVRGKTASYKRIHGGEVIVSKEAHGVSEIKLFPLYPVNTPSFFTTYILVKLSKSVDLAPNEEVVFYTKMPVEVGVYVFKNTGATSLFRVIDVFPVGKVKYCLYGPLDKGVIARYHVSDIYFNEVEPDIGEAIMKIIARNKASEWIEFSRILLESNPLTLSYIEGSWKAYTQEISVVINSVKTASIHYGRRFKENTIAILDPPHLKQPVIHFKTEMLWGV